MNRKVDVRDLQQNLAEYLQTAKNGQTIEIFDGETRVANIEPPEEDGLRIRRAEIGDPHDVALPQPLKTSVDIVDLLREERGDR